MRRGARRLLLGAGAAVLALGVLAAAAGWFLLGTEAGTRFAFRRLGAFIPGSLDIEELHGPIRGPLSARGIVYENETLSIRVARAAFDWRLRELLRRRIDVLQLTAEGVEVRLKDTREKQQESTEFKLPDVKLGVNIALHDASVRDVRIYAAGASEPFVIDSAALESTAEGDVVHVQRLAVRGPRFALDASGEVRPQGAYPVDLQLRWSAEPESLPRLAGRATLGGTLEELRVEHATDAPFASRVAAVVRRPFGEASFAGRVEFDRLDLRDFGQDYPAATLSADARLAGTLAEFSGQGTLAAATELLGDVRAEGGFGRQAERWTFDELAVSFPGGPTRIVASGDVVLEQAGPRFDVAARWSNLAWPLRGEPLFVVAEGNGRARGTPGDYEFDAAGRLADQQLAGVRVPLGRVAARGRGDTAGVKLASFEGAVLAGSVAGAGSVAWSPEVRWNIRVEGRGIDPGQAWPGWSGRLDGRAASEGRLAPDGPRARVAPLDLEGTLRGQPLRAAGGLALAAGAYTLDGVALTWGGLSARADGTAGERWDLDWSLDAPNLAALLPDTAGAIAARGHLAGRGLATPRVQADLTARGLAAFGQEAGEVRARADLDLARGGRLDLDLAAKRLVLGPRGFDRLELQLAGTRERHRLTAALDGEALSLQAALAGGLDPAWSWSGALEQLALRTERAGTWRLARPAALSAGAERVELRDFCWVSGDSRLCAAGHWSAAAGSALEASIADLPLALAEPFFPAGLQVEGALDGSIEADVSPGGDLRADARLETSPGMISYLAREGERARVRFQPASATLRAGPPGVAARVAATLDIGTLEGELRLPDYNRVGLPPAAQRLEGRLVAHISDISLAQAFTTDLDETSGRIDADLAFSGSVERPAIRGSAELKDASANLPRFGLELRGVRARLTGDESGLFQVEARARSGDGEARVDGQAGLVPSQRQPVRLQVTGHRFLVANSPTLRIVASPDLQLTYDGRLFLARGEVRIPEADLVFAGLPEEAIQPSSDVVFVGPLRPQREQQAALAIDARVRVILGDDVELQAQGLKTELTGSLLLIESPGAAPTAVGELSLEKGTFKAYGQDLTIERGRLIFAGGPVANPGLDVRAYRKASDGVTAGIEARGTVEEPIVSLWSDPAMSETDQLSYLVLGRPLERAGPAEGSALTNAAKSLGLKGGNLVAKKIGAQLGLEEARIETKGSIEDASLVLGKYLSPRLYIAYGVGIFQPVNTFRVRFLLSDKWALQAETGVGTSADVTYTVERGGARTKLPPLTLEEATTPRSVPAGEAERTGGGTK
ncbi:MAG: translocation/assembly module TamB domain-containing protein [Acidobacteria bacterium]|nr:translocation/assembly module TamB domain-containing protein [Acidobacteriota bacterium]